MNWSGAILIAASAVFVLAFAAIHLWAAPVVRAGSGGYEIPDLLLEGYPVAYVSGFAERLSPEARAAFLGPFRWLDAVLQVSLTIALALATYLTARRWSVHAALAPGGLTERLQGELRRLSGLRVRAGVDDGIGATKHRRSRRH